MREREKRKRGGGLGSRESRDRGRDRTEKGHEERSRGIEDYIKTQKTESKRGKNLAGAESKSGTKIKEKCFQRLWG